MQEALTRHRPRARMLVVVLLAAACTHAGGTASPSARPGTPVALTAPTTTSSQAPSPRAVPTPPEPTATDTPDAVDVGDAAPPMGAATPVRLQIPVIGVDSDLMGLALQTDGTLEVPPTGFPAGWYTGAPTPGELGPAIIAGHVDWGGEPGVFFDLQDLAPGDEITVTRQDGSTALFRVDRVERFTKDQFPTELVYADLDHAGLRLITCGGDFDRGARSYEDNLVVFARLVETVEVVPAVSRPWSGRR